MFKKKKNVFSFSTMIFRKNKNKKLNFIFFWKILLEKGQNSLYSRWALEFKEFPRKEGNKWKKQNNKTT